MSARSGLAKTILAFLLTAYVGAGQAPAQSLQAIMFTPPDGDTLAQAFPVFTWISLQPGGGPVVLRVYEMLPGQAKEAAVLSNPVYHQSQPVNGNTYIYPVSAPSLQAGGTYAWQLSSTAPDNPAPLYSEPSQFTLAAGAEQPDTTVLDTVYYLAGPTIENISIPLQNGRLNFLLSEAYGTEHQDSVLGFFVVDNSGSVLLENDGSLVVHYGHNTYSLDFSLIPSSPLVLHEEYTFCVKDPKNQLQYIRFRYE